MTQEILDHLQDVLDELKRLSVEIDENMDQNQLNDDMLMDLNDLVYEPLSHIIDNLDDIVTSVNKLDDVEYYNNTDDEEYN